MDWWGRCNEETDDTIVSPSIAEAFDLKNVGKLRNISAVELQGALKEGEKAHLFTAPRSCTVLCLILHLVVGQRALLNVTFVIEDADLAQGDLLSGLIVLRRLRIDLLAMLELNQAALNVTIGLKAAS